MLGIFLDSEANGLNFQKHKVIEVAYKILDVGTGELKDQYQAVVKQSKEDWQRSDPDSLAVNGFTWEDVAAGKEREKIKEEIVATFAKWGIKRGEAVFICQNPSFDRAYFAQLVDPDTQEKLSWPYHWLDLASMYWTESVKKGKENPNLFPWATGFSKDRIAASYKLPSEETPHRAMNGVNHLILCYRTVVGFPLEKIIKTI